MGGFNLCHEICDTYHAMFQNLQAIRIEIKCLDTIVICYLSSIFILRVNLKFYRALFHRETEGMLIS